MGTDALFEQLREEARAEVKRKRQEQERNAEIDRKCREALRPYAEQGYTWGQVMQKEHCPWSLMGMYDELLKETEADRAAKKEQQPEPQEDPFIIGFQHDPTLPLVRSAEKKVVI